MQKKLTITIAEEVYRSLRPVILIGKISRFVKDLVRPHLIRHRLESAYRAMAEDKIREKEALEWIEAAIQEI